MSDLKGPGPETAPRGVKTGGLLPDSQEHILRYFLGGGSINGPAGSMENQGGVALVQHLQRLLLAFEQIRHQLFVRALVSMLAGALASDVLVSSHRSLPCTPTVTANRSDYCSAPSAGGSENTMRPPQWPTAPQSPNQTSESENPTRRPVAGSS